MDLVPSIITGSASRLAAAAQNALEVARFGGLETGEQPSVFEVVAEQRVYRLRRYFPPENGSSPGPPVLLVPPLMLAAEVYDVAPAASAVASLRENGADPWVVDFGAPEHEQGGLERTVTDHILGVSDAVDRVRKATGQDVHLAGYSQGGMFCYQAAAYRRSAGVRSVITFGSPVDTLGALPFGIPEELATRGAGALATIVANQAIPAWFSREAFRLLDPVKSLRQRIDFVRQLHDRDALLPRERQRRFLQGEGWVAWPGPAIAELMRQFVAHNRMLVGGFTVEDRLVTLADISVPILTFVGEVDEIAPPKMVRAVRQAAPAADVYEVLLHAGHFGLVVGGGANRTTWPVVAQWARWRQGDDEIPATARKLDGDPDDETRNPPSSAGARSRLDYGVRLAGNVGLGVARTALASVRPGVGAVREYAREASGQMPRIARLDAVRSNSRVSLGRLLAEQTASDPDEIMFLFEDRGHTRAAVNGRIDNVVKGLVSLGVRQGHHVGVLMATRPSGLAVVAALNRLGAVAVLMRPDGEVTREAELGNVGRVIADPELASIACDALDVPVLVLGGGGDARDLGDRVIDMERIDPDRVDLPRWFEADPGRGSELAFILFTGSGERVRANRITNGRWALSAFGTATAASLTSSDTVYAVTPIHHPSGLLMSLGGSVAGGSRIALARHFDPTTFWDEVRRYGVTVASYTWTMLHDVVEAPRDDRELGHPVRLFIGSGMPRGMWRRATNRFAPARVLEFYASTEGEAILANVPGDKPGCMGRPLPGTAEVRIAKYDPVPGRLIEGADGFACPVARGEVGVMLAAVRGDLVTPTGSPLRGVFEAGDAWLDTGDLFRRDADGDYWFVGNVAAVVDAAAGPIATRPIVDALEDIDAVDLAVAYGVKGPDSELAVAAATLRVDETLTAKAVSHALEGLDPDCRPMIVRVVKGIPVTTWYRPLTDHLRADGVPRASKNVFALNARGTAYSPLTAARRRAILGGEDA